MANQELHHRQLRIGHMHSSVKCCRSIKDRNRLWKVSVRDLVRDICCVLHKAGFCLHPEGRKAINKALVEADEQTQRLKQIMLQVRTEIDSSRAELQAANKIQSEIEDMRKQLAQATNDIQTQQKVLSSSEEFVKSIFSSHVVEIFNIGQPPKDHYAIIPPPTKAIKNTVVWLLLDAAPIQGTLQLQYHISVQPPNSYFRIAHNLIVFFWGDPAENLERKPLTVSYFPDKSDKELIHSLSERDGRVFADDEPLPKFNEPDPDFKGNKWISPEGKLMK